MPPCPQQGHRGWTTGQLSLAVIGNQNEKSHDQFILRGLGFHPPFHFLSNGYWRTKRSERKDNHSPPSSVEVKNGWSYISAPPYVFMAWFLVKYRAFMVWYLVKHRDNFYFIIVIQYELFWRWAWNEPSNLCKYTEIYPCKIFKYETRFIGSR